jgi:sterol desaturase/sphingolipid hydroxylase (fatty acid hydroxylase superfamily)
MNLQLATVVLSIFIFFAIIESRNNGFFRKPGATNTDHWADGVSFVLVSGLTVPFVLWASGSIAGHIVPSYKGALETIPWWQAFILLLIFDDFAQYCWHRLSHSWPWMYRFHRAHHEASYMSVRVAYRNNLIFIMLMPSFWFTGLLIYLGVGWTYAGYLLAKQLVVLSAHSDSKWDAQLFKIPALHYLSWLLERVFSTPSTHHMHHGKHLSDGITHYKGNYGNFLFMWDMLFGTGKITRQYPKQYGTEGLEPVSWEQQILLPKTSSRDLG